MASNIPETIVMIRHILVIDFRTVLRTMLSAGMLAVLLACAGTAAGAAWTVDAAIDEDSIEVWGGTYYENVDVGKSAIADRGAGSI